MHLTWTGNWVLVVWVEEEKMAQDPRLQLGNDKRNRNKNSGSPSSTTT